MATDVDLYDNHVGGSIECVEAVLGDLDPEALPITLDARLDMGADTTNAPRSRRRQLVRSCIRFSGASFTVAMRTWIPYIAVACLLVGLMSACVSSPTPSLTVTALPTATPTPTPVRGVDPNAAPATNRNAATTRARHLAERFDEGGVERAYFLDRYVIVTGTAVHADALKDRGRQVVVLEGTAGTRVLCERPRGFMPRELSEPLPSGGLPVLVAGRVSESRSGEDVVIVDCTVLKTGREVEPRSIAKLPAITNVFQGWGLFWAWALFAGLGYLLALRRWRVTSPWLLTVFVLSHTGGMSALYAFLGSLVLPYYEASGAGSLAVWPLILAFID